MTATIKDYEEVLADHRRLVREMDVAMNGEAGEAKQASLCDLVAQMKQSKVVSKALFERMLFALEAARSDFQGYEQERSGEDYNNPALNAIIEAAQQ